ncbi:MAG TPA: adenylate/guanylate cyclase domain-containing protein [Myxococcaceae bacterium]|jgi:class 3 adenylate cyclase
MWQLIINGPGYFDTTYDLPEGLTSLGRADENDIVLSGDLVSRKHAKIYVQGDDLTIEDLGSRNGSRLNGQPFTGTADLKAGDLVHVGENTLSIRQPNKVENQATEMVDLGAGGVKRYGEGMDIGASVVVSKNVKESVVLRALDNIMPFTPREGIPLPDFDVPAGSGAGGDRPTPLPNTLPAASPSGGTPTPITYDALLLLYKVSEALSTSRTQQAFLELTADRVLESVKATTAVVLLRHHSGVMVPAVVRHRGRLAQGEVPVSDAVISAALSKGAALAVQDVRGDVRFNARESVLLYGVDQVLCIPIGEKEPFSGVLYINKPAGPANELEGLIDLCSAVSHLIASGVERFRNAGATAVGPERGRATLDRFFPPAIAERRAAELQRSGNAAPKLEELTLSVVVADLAGFTALTQKLEPALVADLLSELYSRATAVVFSFEGTLEKFVGDAVVAVFGAPYAQTDGPLRAVRAAMTLRQDWAKAVARRPAHARPDLKIAVNTGKGLAGLIGPEGRQDYAVVGDVVNVASWLCASALPGQVLITGKTLASIGARFDVTPLGERGLKPGREKVPVFEVMEEDVASMTSPGPR